jgi:F-type H+-transporting ATPase subunit a
MSAPIPIAAEPVFRLGGLTVTNSMLNGWIATGLLLLVCLLLRRRLRERPKGMQLVAETVVDGLLGLFDKVTGDREASKRLFPVAGSLFIFILLSNWLGLVPGTGSVGVWHEMNGEPELVPLLRPATSDLNLTIAMALFVVVGSQAAAIRTLGLWTQLGKYFPMKPLGRAIFSLRPAKIMTAIMEFVIGVIEFVGEGSKVASLSLRLFGNIFAGEVLLTSISSLVAYVAPLPFLGLELAVGALQAMFFAVLASVYFTLARLPAHGEAH